MRDKSRALTRQHRGPARPVRDRAKRGPARRSALHNDTCGNAVRFAQAGPSVIAFLCQCASNRRIGWSATRLAGPDCTSACRRTGASATDRSERTANDIGLFWPPQRQPVLVTRTEGRCNGTIAARSEVRWRGVGGVALSERPAISLKRQLGGNQ